jgi:hypothetical protein
MSVASRVLLVAFLTVPSIATAQHGDPSAASAPSAPAEAKQHDFLVGQWELSVKVPATSLATRLHGMPKLVGSWKAWRAFDGYGIEDELRITDASGNPVTLVHSLRYYDRTTRQWNITSLDVYRGKVSTLTSSWGKGTMLQESRGVDQEGKPYLVRARFIDITPTAFRFRQDRSYDDGKSWKEDTLVIQAKRVAAMAPR